MVGLRPRKKVEGWALDISNPNDERKGVGFVQRIGDSNKLWTICFIGVLLLTAFLYLEAKHTDPLPQGQPGFRGIGDYDDEAHTAFVEKFITSKSYGSAVESARFINQERFEIVAKRGVSADEIEYAAKMAASIILEKFRQRVVVEVYDEIPSGKRLLARTEWSSKKLGYVLKFTDKQAAD
jgi:hypothetical protein